MEKEKIHPASAIKALNNYHSDVVQLIVLVDMAIRTNLIDPSISEQIESATKKVQNYFDGKDK